MFRHFKLHVQGYFGVLTLILMTLLPFHWFQDIHGSFPDLGIVSIVIETNDGRYKAGAKLSVENPEVLDDWPESRRNVFVKNKEVSVCVGNSDGWLCVAKLLFPILKKILFTLRDFMEKFVKHSSWFQKRQVWYNSEKFFENYT